MSATDINVSKRHKQAVCAKCRGVEFFIYLVTGERPVPVFERFTCRTCGCTILLEHDETNERPPLMVPEHKQQ